VRKLIESTLVSADGVFEDPPAWSREYRDEANAHDGLAQALACDALVLGRRTYEILAGSYPQRTDPWADRINAMPKYVCSSTLARADWQNSTILRGDVVAEVTRLKQQAGHDLLTYGHGRLAETLLKHHVLDVLDLAIHPVVVGAGKPLFRVGQHATLRLVATKTYSKGIVRLTYELHD
jgi:dihydrofolate reductase